MQRKGHLIQLIFRYSLFHSKQNTDLFQNRKHVLLAVIRPCDGILPCLLYKKVYFSLVGKKIINHDGQKRQFETIQC